MNLFKVITVSGDTPLFIKYFDALELQFFMHKCLIDGPNLDTFEITEVQTAHGK